MNTKTHALYLPPAARPDAQPCTSRVMKYFERAAPALAAQYGVAVAVFAVRPKDAINSRVLAAFRRRGVDKLPALIAGGRAYVGCGAIEAYYSSDLFRASHAPNKNSRQRGIGRPREGFSRRDGAAAARARAIARDGTYKRQFSQSAADSFADGAMNADTFDNADTFGTAAGRGGRGRGRSFAGARRERYSPNYYGADNDGAPYGYDRAPYDDGAPYGEEPADVDAPYDEDYAPYDEDYAPYDEDSAPYDEDSAPYAENSTSDLDAFFRNEMRVSGRGSNIDVSALGFRDESDD